MTEASDINSSYVTVGQPVEGGCCWTSFADSPTLPTDATTKMSTLTDFVSLGDLSDEGYTKSHSVTSNKFKSWHGSVVLTCISEEEHKYKMEFIEINRPSVAKINYGSKNVETDATTGAIKHIAGKPYVNETYPLVIDELDSDGYLRRTVVHKASIDEFDDEPHKKGNLLIYGMTFTAIDDDGFFDIYRAKPAEA